MLSVLAQSDSPSAIILVLAVLGTIMIVFLIAKSGERNDLMERLAVKLDGKFIGGGVFEGPSIQFSLGGRKATLEVFESGQHRNSYSRVSVDLGRMSGSLHILPEGVGQSFLKVLGGQDLEVGDAAFDAAYVVKAQPASLAARIFSPERRADVIRSVRRIGFLTDPTIDAGWEGLTVRVREAIKVESQLMNLVKTAEDFLGYLAGTPDAAGIQWGEVGMAAGGACPVCGTQLGPEAGRCSSCKTPHHRECWDYMGRCSTYACKGTRFIA